MKHHRIFLIAVVVGAAVGISVKTIFRHDAYRPGHLRSLTWKLHRAAERSLKTKTDLIVQYRFTKSHGLLMLVPPYADLAPEYRKLLPEAVVRRIHSLDKPNVSALAYLDGDKILDFRTFPPIVEGLYGLERGDEVTVQLRFKEGHERPVQIRLAPSSELNAVA